MAGKHLRMSARHRVHLGVRYASASEFVQEYATNLSQGGLFIPDAHHLEPLSVVKVEISLPGSGSYEITGEVAHVIDAEMARRMGQAPGAGIAIKRGPKGFRDALSAYLQRLGRRADVMVFVAGERCAAVLADAGYRVEPAPEPVDLAAAFVRAPVEVIAIVVPRAQGLVYRQAAAASGAGDVVLEMDSPVELDDVLERLDDRL